MKLQTFRAIGFVSLVLLPAMFGARADSPALAPEVAKRVAVLVRSLDAEDFVERREAAGQLALLANQPELQHALAAALRRKLLQTTISTEVRLQLDKLLSGLPPGLPAAKPEKASAVQIERLIRLLDHDAYAQRSWARRRLERLLENTKMVCPIMLQLKRRLADGSLSSSRRAHLHLLWRRAHRLWLQSDPSGWELPKVSEKQIDQWLAELVRKSPLKQGRWHVHETARRELLDLLVRDEYTEQVKAKLFQRLGAPGPDQKIIDRKNLDRLRRLAEWTRPAMAAEIWRKDTTTGKLKNMTVQHLIVGVAQWPEMGRTTTHFDRINEKTAHLVNGNTLEPGDYPVGRAFPYPGFRVSRWNIFYLINLPTPRRRLAYQYNITNSETRRLADMSRNTLDRILFEKRKLSSQELAYLIPYLDQRAVSRFAGKYFEIPDPFGEKGVSPPAPPGSGKPFDYLGQQRAFFQILYARGTHEAVPGLLKAIENKRFAAANAEHPQNLPWITALAIARRETRTEIDSLLASFVERTDRLLLGDVTGPDVGATAAAILLSRHGKSLAVYGVEPHESPKLRGPAMFNTKPATYSTNSYSAGIEVNDFSAFRFRSPEHRKKVLDWWKQRLVALSRRTAP